MKQTIIFRIITRLNNGGPAKHAIWLSGMLNAKKFKTVLISGKTEHNEDDIIWYAKKYSVSPLIIPNLKRSLNPISDLIALVRIYRLILKERPHILHSHMSKAGFIGRGAAIIFNLFHRRKIKIIHTFHGHVFHSYFSGIKTRLFIGLEKILAKKTDLLVCISPRLKNEIQRILKIGNPEKFKIIPLGIDFLPPPKNRRQESQNRYLHVGMLGRLAPVKNYQLAVEIARELAREKIPVKILIGGGGSTYDFEKLQQDKINNISFLGNIEDSRKFWEKIDIAMVTSKNEGTPVALIEAMISEIPFIASHVGGIPDMTSGSVRREGNLLIYDNCILIQDFHPYDFVKALRFFSDNEIRRNAGNVSRQFAKEKFSSNRLVFDIETLYRDLLENE